MTTTQAARILTLLALCLFFATSASASFAQNTRAVSLNRFLYSRQAQQDSEGYYYQPLGVGEDYPDAARTQERLDRDFAVMRDAGIKLLRVGISWGSIEHQPGQYDWAFWDRLVNTCVKNHVELIPYVCYAPDWSVSYKNGVWTQPPGDPALFGDFMRTISSRYKGRVHSWELWNEPDNPGFWQGSVEQFAALVKAGAQGVRAGDPDATIVLGGIAGETGFLRTLIDQYHIGDYVDAINFHNYFETWSSDLLEDIPSYAQEMIDAQGGASSPRDIWMAEFGYSDMLPGSGSGIYDTTYQHTPEFQAVALWRMQILALSTGKLSLTTWYRINDLPPDVDVIGDENNRYLGLVDVHGAKKPVFYAMRFYNQLFDQPSRPIDKLVRVERPAASKSIVHVFELKDHTLLVTGWLRTPQPGDLPAGDGVDNRQETISVALPAGVWGKLTDFDAIGQPVETHARLSGRTLSGVSLTGPSIFIARIGH